MLEAKKKKKWIKRAADKSRRYSKNKPTNYHKVAAAAANVFVRSLPPPSLHLGKRNFHSYVHILRRVQKHFPPGIGQLFYYFRLVGTCAISHMIKTSPHGSIALEDWFSQSPVSVIVHCRNLSAASGVAIFYEKRKKIWHWNMQKI